MYQALAKGFYRDEGLDVTILPGGPGAGIKLKVAKGEADFGMNRSDDLIVAVARGMPFVIVGASLQHDPQALMVHAASPVQTFKDLQGRIVSGFVSMTWIPYLQRRFGIQFDLRQNTYGLGEFLTNPEAIQQCYVTNEPYFARQHGKAVRTLLLADAGYDCYPALFCRRELVRNSPEVVTAFVAATIRGWRDYVENDPAPANALIMARNPQMTAEFLAFCRDELIQHRLVRGDPARGEDIGQISEARIRGQLEVLREFKLLDQPLDVDAVATRAFLPPPRP